MTDHVKIISRAKEMYMHFGVKSVTMEDIAHDLGMSKKTLYQYFSDKDELVKKAMQFHLNFEHEMVESIQSKNQNAIDTMLDLADHLAENLRSLNPSCIYDLQKYFPECWTMFKKHKQNFIYNLISDNIRQGVEEGYYNEDLNVDIIARFYIGRLEMMRDNEIFPHEKYSMPEILREYINYHLRSICSKKGLEYFHKITKRQKAIA